MVPSQDNVIKHHASRLRLLSLRATTAAGSGHLTSCLSAADMVAALFFGAMHYDPCDHANPHNDRFILSKGHAAPLLYAVYVELGILSEEQLMTLRKFDSVLEGHPISRFLYSEAATGSLGVGLSIALGFALQARLDATEYYTYVLMGDSEVAEGSVWEAVEVAAYYKLDTVIAMLDVNRLGQSSQTMAGADVEQHQRKFAAFGWRTLLVDGHDTVAVAAAYSAARKRTGQPTIIIAHTIKGQGLAFLADKEGWHGKAVPVKDLAMAEAALASYAGNAVDQQQTAQLTPCKPPKQAVHQQVALPTPAYKLGENIATRYAYGQALVALGTLNQDVVVLDAEVKNSTYAELFEAVFPKRFIQCFVAEQNMVGMAVGLAHRGKVPFASTFGCFFSRAYDQVRMAAIGGVAVRLVGSHAGVSIGHDGPSQMALEDIALMRLLPHAIVLYPSDAVSTYKLVNLMMNYHDGISYLRTTRGATPVIYENNTEFVIGGLHVLQQSEKDVVCIVAAGITLFEALKAYQQLKEQGVLCTVIDCYSIKPLPVPELLAAARKAGNLVATVEDHYRAGGLGEAVAAALGNAEIKVESLAVDKLPRSGAPEELMRFEAIDAAAIVAAVRKLVK